MFDSHTHLFFFSGSVCILYPLFSGTLLAALVVVCVWPHAAWLRFAMCPWRQVTHYPELEHTQTELALLSSLYSVYEEVQTFDAELKDILWAKAKLPSLVDKVDVFHDRIKDLNPRLHKWQAYKVRHSTRSCGPTWSANTVKIILLRGATIRVRGKSVSVALTSF